MKGNMMFRMISMMIIVPILLAHWTGQIDLSHAYWLWLTLFAGANAFQATFTGFCPVSKFMPKDPETGACCASDTTGTCCTPEPSETKSACCSSEASDSKSDCCSSEASDKKSTCCSGNDGLKIKVLGTGCASCESTVKLIQKIADENQVAVNIVKVEEIEDIAGYGVMSTPGVVIEDKVVHSGGIPTKEAILGWLK